MARAISITASNRVMITWRALLTIAALGCLVAGWIAPSIWVLACVVGAATFVAILRFPIFGLCLLSFSVPWGREIGLPIGGATVTPTDGIVAAVGIAWLAWCIERGRNPIATWLWT